MTTFGEKLVELRKAADLTQVELAAKSGVPIGTVRDYEQEARDPLLSNAQRLATALGVSLDAFPPAGNAKKKNRRKRKGGTR
jgi:transcriptional regulator with XRE-family HTH domain